jgi:hypothetical protein
VVVYAQVWRLPEPGFLEGVKSKDKAILKMHGMAFQYPGTPKPQLTGVSLQVGTVVLLGGPRLHSTTQQSLFVAACAHTLQLTGVSLQLHSLLVIGGFGPTHLSVLLGMPLAHPVCNEQRVSITAESKAVV